MATTGRMPLHTTQVVALVPLAGCRGAPGADGAYVLPSDAKRPGDAPRQLPEIGRAGYINLLYSLSQGLWARGALEGDQWRSLGPQALRGKRVGGRWITFVTELRKRP